MEKVQIYISDISQRKIKIKKNTQRKGEYECGEGQNKF
jgi:hypothetical protein